MVARLEALGGEVPRLPDGLEHRVVVLATARDARLHDVADGAQQRVELGLRLVGGGL